MQAVAYEGYFRNGRFYADGEEVYVPENHRVIVTVLEEYDDHQKRVEAFHDFPILEYDPDRNAFIRPENFITPIDGIAEHAVICFLADAIEKVVAAYPHKIISHINGEGIKKPVYQLEYKGREIVLVQAVVGAPLAAGYIEELTVFGCKKFMACGGCGVLQPDLAVGHLIIPTSAVRDEGTSYHYAPPSREIEMDAVAVAAIESALTEANAPYIKAKTWTTDAFYRETPAKIAMRKDEGCVTVEMETSAFIAVARYNNVPFGQILYAGDSLAGEVWDRREWNKQPDVRELVLRLTMDACLKLS